MANPYTYDEIMTQIAAAKANIEGLNACLIKGIANGDVLKYKLNTGQTEIDTEFRALVDIQRAIASEEARLFRWSNMLGGNTTVLRDANTILKR